MNGRTIGIVSLLLSLPGLTRQSIIYFAKKMDARIKSGHDELWCAGWRILIVLLAVSCNQVAAAESTQLPSGFVRLREVAPTIRQDIRYAGAFNFTGRRVPGYEAAECILLRDVAAALARVQALVARDGFHLKVYDCYRPARAVLSFIDWAQNAEPDTMGPVFSPQIPKSQQFTLGYLAKRSKHSLGTAVDLGMVRASDPDVPPPSRAGPCDGPFSVRAKESSLDFGTAYDCASPFSATRAPGVSAQARANRDRLVRAMAAEGFRNYAKEWWHFEFGGPTPPLRTYDFVIR